MATNKTLKYKDGSGVIHTVTADFDYVIEFLDIPEEHEYSVKITDDQSNTETHEFIGAGIKR